MSELTKGMLLSLVVLSTGQNHGYAVMCEIETITSGQYRVPAGSLYRALHKLVELEMIEEIFITDETDERKRNYRITSKGLSAINAELQRMLNLVKVAQEYISHVPGLQIEKVK